MLSNQKKLFCDVRRLNNRDVQLSSKIFKNVYPMLIDDGLHKQNIFTLVQQLLQYKRQLFKTLMLVFIIYMYVRVFH